MELLLFDGERDIDISDNDNGHGGQVVDGDANFAAAGLYPIEITYFNGDWTSDGAATLYATVPVAPRTAIDIADSGSGSRRGGA